MFAPPWAPTALVFTSVPASAGVFFWQPWGMLEDRLSLLQGAGDGLPCVADEGSWTLVLPVTPGLLPGSFPLVSRPPSFWLGCSPWAVVQQRFSAEDCCCSGHCQNPPPECLPLCRCAGGWGCLPLCTHRCCLGHLGGLETRGHGG